MLVSVKVMSEMVEVRVVVSENWSCEVETSVKLAGFQAVTIPPRLPFASTQTCAVKPDGRNVAALNMSRVDSLVS